MTNEHDCFREVLINLDNFISDGIVNRFSPALFHKLDRCTFVGINLGHLDKHIVSRV